MAEEGVAPSAVRSRKMPIFVFFKDSSLVFKMDSLGREILAIAIPAAMALAADPIASLIDTAFIGHIVLLSLAMQGVFRGFKDTRTPLYASVIGDLANIILDPILIFVCRMGVSGAAIAHVLSQYLITLILFVRLFKEVDLLPPSFGELQFSRFFRSGSLLLCRVVAATICVTLATSLAAWLGSIHMAAFHICVQVWLASSLLADGLAVAGQAIIASAFAEKNYEKATAAASRVLQMGFIMGLGLALAVGLGLHFGSGVFNRDKEVLYTISTVVLIVAGNPENEAMYGRLLAKYVDVLY